MSKQKNILNFFKPVAVKRTSSENGELNGTNKKIKIDEQCDSTSEDVTKSKLSKLIKELPILDINMGESWFYGLEKEFEKPYFKELNDFVEMERSKYAVYPPQDKVWSWTKLCPVSKIRVVIIGQDPYFNPKQAHGLCFSVPRGVEIPPSLVNIYKELKDDIEDFVIPNHGDLTSWAEQGILLLNACLTVREKSPNSHNNKGWEKITETVIKYISDKNKGVVFMLWGKYAQMKASCVNQKRHHILKAAHPSPMSALRGFFGCKHFSKCNSLLVEEGRQPINWNSVNNI